MQVTPVVTRRWLWCLTALLFQRVRCISIQTWIFPVNRHTPVAAPMRTTSRLRRGFPMLTSWCRSTNSLVGGLLSRQTMAWQPNLTTTTSSANTAGRPILKRSTWTWAVPTVWMIAGALALVLMPSMPMQKLSVIPVNKLLHCQKSARKLPAWKVTNGVTAGTPEFCTSWIKITATV